MDQVQVFIIYILFIIVLICSRIAVSTLYSVQITVCFTNMSLRDMLALPAV